MALTAAIRAEEALALTTATFDPIVQPERVSTGQLSQQLQQDTRVFVFSSPEHKPISKTEFGREGRPKSRAMLTPKSQPNVTSKSPLPARQTDPRAYSIPRAYPRTPAFAIPKGPQQTLQLDSHGGRTATADGPAHPPSAAADVASARPRGAHPRGVSPSTRTPYAGSYRAPSPGLLDPELPKRMLAKESQSPADSMAIRTREGGQPSGSLLQGPTTISATGLAADKNGGKPSSKVVR